MPVLEKDSPSTTPIVRLRDAIPGERYALNNGALVEIIISEQSRKSTGKLVKTRNSKGEIQVWLINKKYRRIKNENGKDTFSRFSPDTELQPVVRRGPRRRNDGLRWRAWGLRNRDKMDAVVKISEEEGFYIKWPPSWTSHFACIGFQGQNVCALFVAGLLGFQRKPESTLYVYPAVVKECPAGHYPYRIPFKDLPAEQWPEFLTVFRRHLKEQKRVLISRTRAAW